MQWITTPHVHLDRVATPWLIRRFVDDAASFAYASGPDEVDHDVRERGSVFGMPGIALSSYNDEGTVFSKVLRQYRLDDPALRRMERIVAAGVRHALSIPAPANETDEERTLGAALDILGLGLGVTFDDDDHIAHGMAIYDALFTICRVRCLTAQVQDAIPANARRIAYLRDALAAPVE